MLEITVVLAEGYDETTEKFVKSQTWPVRLEHSLVSLSKWESVWETPFLSKQARSAAELASYVKFMMMDDNVPPEVFYKLIQNHAEEIEQYISAKMTASSVPESQDPGRRETITAELIYYWMISLKIPMTCENWHLNRLLMLIRVVNYKNTPAKKRTAEERRLLNEQRRAQYRTRG